MLNLVAFYYTLTIKNQLKTHENEKHCYFFPDLQSCLILLQR